MDVRTLRCSNCGGDLTEGARICPFCRATVEARRCDTCFHLNLADARHCAACGRELGLEPMPEPEALPCPICLVAFQAIPSGSGYVHECPKCAGQFIEHPTLRTLFEEHLMIAVAGGAKPFEASPESQRVRYVPCPMCAKVMNRKNFGDRSGVIVDVCRAHGIWFDAGELPRVLAFVQAGGLAEAERREAARKALETKQAAEVHVGMVTAGMMDDLRRTTDPTHELVDFVVSLFR